MKPIEELLQNLARPEVLEFGLVTNRLPSVNVGGRFEPVDTEAPTTTRVLEMLVAMGGARYVEGLTDKPVQWTARLEGVGVIAVAAIKRRDVVQARFTVAKRDPGLVARPSGPPPRVSIAPGWALASRPPLPPAPPAPPAARAPDSAGTLVAASVSVPSSGPSVVVPPPPSDAWDDDDEPTVQTSSPPVRIGKGESGLPIGKSPSSSPGPKKRTSSAAMRAVSPPSSRSSPVSAPVLPVAQASDGASPPKSTPAVPRDTARTLGSFVEGAVAASARPPAQEPVPSAAAPSTDATPDVEDEVAESRPPARPSQQARAASESIPPLPPPPLPAIVPDDEVTHAKPPESRAPKSGTITAPHVPSVSAVEPAKSDVAVDSASSLLALVTSARATDAHLVGGRPVLLRVARDLAARGGPLAPTTLDRLLEELLPATRRAQLEAEGACEATFMHAEHGRFRLRATKHHGGKRLHVRVLPREVPSLATLGVPEPVSALARAPRGVLLVASPTGQGRSSTMLGLVDALDGAAAKRIVVIADDASLGHPTRLSLVTHHELGADVATVEDARLVASRADADVVVFDTTKDAARVTLSAVSLAEAGKLVVLTVACAGAAHAVDRLLDGLAPRARVATAERLARVLRAILGQRLVPCEDRTRLHAVFELVPSSLPLFAAVRDGRPGAVAALLARGRQPGGITLEDALGDLVRAGKTTHEIARSYADRPDDVAVSEKSSFPERST